MSRQLRFSRWKRLPGLHRVTERKIPTHLTELQRFTLYLPGELLDLAEELATQSGARTPQHFCEELLTRALLGEEVEQESKVEGIVNSAMADAADYLFQESLDTERDLIIEPSGGMPAGSQFFLRLNEPAFLQLPALPGPEAEPVSGPDRNFGSSTLASDARTEVLRQAGLQEPVDPSAFLVALRQGESPGESGFLSLIQALEALERSLTQDQPLDRELAYALHRLAYEPQVLLSEAWPALAQDQATLQGVRMIQTLVERIFKGPGV